MKQDGPPILVSKVLTVVHGISAELHESIGHSV